MKAFLAGIGTALLCSGCATTVLVNPVVPPEGTRTPAISNTSVILPDTASVDLPVGVFPLGRLTQGDMQILQDSIKASIENARRSSHALVAESPQLHVVVRSLIHQYSNHDGYLLGCVAYCIATQNGTIIHQEQFYVRAKKGVVMTPGALLNSFNKRATERIVQGVLNFYDGLSIPPASPDGVSDKFDDVASTMPKAVCSYYSAAALAGMFTGSTSAETIWNLAEKKEPIEWDSYLKR